VDRWAIMLVSISLGAVGQMFLKRGIDGVGAPLFQSIAGLAGVLFSPFVFIGFLFYGVSALIWLKVLSLFPLSVAYPLLSLGYVAVIFFSAILFGERITLDKAVGVLFICIGAFIIGRK